MQGCAKTLSPEETAVLSRGMNFAITPRELPKEDIESAMRTTRRKSSWKFAMNHLKKKH